MARTIIEQSKNYTRKDFINSRNGLALQELSNDKITITACAVLNGEDEKGNPTEIGSIVTTDNIYTTISANIIDSIRDLIAIEEEEGAESYTVQISKRVSKQGREFLSLIIL